MHEYKVYKRSRQRAGFNNGMEENEKNKKLCLVPGTPAKLPPQRPTAKKVYQRQSKKKLATQEKDSDMLLGSSSTMVSSIENHRLLRQEEMGFHNPSACCVTMLPFEEKTDLFISTLASIDKEEDSYDRTGSLSLDSVGTIDLNMDFSGMIGLDAREKKDVSKEHRSDGIRVPCSEPTLKGQEQNFDGIEGLCLDSTGLIDLNKSIYTSEDANGSNEHVMQTLDVDSTHVDSDAAIEALGILDVKEMNGDFDDSGPVLRHISSFGPLPPEPYADADAMSQGAATNLEKNFSSNKETNEEKSNFSLPQGDGLWGKNANGDQMNSNKPLKKPRKKYKAKVVTDRKRTTTKPATPKQVTEKKSKPANPKTNEGKPSVRRNLKFAVESMDTKCKVSPPCIVPNKKRRSKRRKLNLFTTISQEEMEFNNLSASCVTMLPLEEKTDMFISTVAMIDKEEHSYDRTESSSPDSVGTIDLNMDFSGMMGLDDSEKKEHSSDEIQVSDGIESLSLDSTSLIDLNKSIYTSEDANGSNEDVMETLDVDSIHIDSDAAIEALGILDSKEMNEGFNDSDQVSIHIPSMERQSLFRPLPSEPYAYADAISQGAATNLEKNFPSNKETNEEKSNFRLPQGDGLLGKNANCDQMNSNKPLKKPRRKKYKPKVVTNRKKCKAKVVSDRKQTTTKPVPPKQVTEKKSTPANLKTNECKPSVRRKLNFAVESMDTECKISPLCIVPNKKRRSKRRRKLNLFTITQVIMTKNGKNSKNVPIIINWYRRKRRLQRKSPHVREKNLLVDDKLTEVHDKQGMTEATIDKHVKNTFAEVCDNTNATNFQNKVKRKRKHKEKPTDVQNKVTHEGKGSHAKDQRGYTREEFMDLLTKMQSLHISFEGTMVPYLKNRTPKVALDPETARVWTLLMHIEDDTRDENASEENEWLEKERKVFEDRASTFISRMHCIQGVRKYEDRNSSVLDSVIGVILTQNVSDQNSSNAFMSLAAKFPSKQTSQDTFCDRDMEIEFGQKLVESSMTADPTEYDANGNAYFVSEPRLERNIDEANNVEHLGQLEDSFEENLNQIHTQFQSDMQAHFEMGLEQQFQSLAWISNNDDRDMPLSEDHQRDVEYFASSSGGYACYFGTAKHCEQCSSGPRGDMHLGKVTEPEIEDIGSACNLNCLATFTSCRGCLRFKNTRLSRDSHYDSNEMLPCKKKLEDGCKACESTYISNLKEVEIGKAFDTSQSCREELLNFQSPNMPIVPVDKVKQSENAKVQQDDAKVIRKKIPKAKVHGSIGRKSKTTSKGGDTKNGEKLDDRYWESLRIKYSNGQRSHADLVDWEAVRLAHVDEVASAIKERGQHNRLAKTIQDLLDRLFRLHKCLDLEWLQNTIASETKKYLLAISGLGLKSVECVRLLALNQPAFPVDTNVARIAVRLGWVPLEPLPANLQLHQLELYPDLNSIQIYLWPRLSKLSHENLYELHCHMITFGKVFCTKRKPNCNQCPMKSECKYYASKMRKSSLPSPFDVVKASIHVSNSPTATVNPLPPLEYRTCEPIVEEPSESLENVEAEKSQEREPEQEPEYDLEGIPTFKLNLQKCSANNSGDGDNSKALVALNSKSSSKHAPKLRHSSQLRTEHIVVELPRKHILLQGLERTKSDKETQYHFAIWSPGETADSTETPIKRCNFTGSELCDEETCFSCNSVQEKNANVFRGTLLIPSRVANGGSFPLNATYFQFEEVFADHETSLKPLIVPREWLYNLKIKIAYFGSTISTLLKGAEMEHVQECFNYGIVCFRGFDRRTRLPTALAKRFHCRQTAKKIKNLVLMLEEGQTERAREDSTN